ncbi:hypothetical protein [Actinospica robiniae]|uniref:hypothetical protein n=1 Tax=Actinospica robiniae TaxID=304901 RepID=UPI0005509308|nr:hypothetical protein [Actinospica robiniae]
MTSTAGIRRPSRLGLIARLVVTVAVAGGATVGAVLVRSSPAAATDHSTEPRPSNLAVATAEAQQLLDEFLAPTGSNRLPGRPTNVDVSTGKAGVMAMPYQVSETAWWQAAQPLKDLMTWLGQHPERGLTSVAGDGAASSDSQTITFSGRPDAASLDGIQLTVTAYALADDSTVLRVVADVDYVPPRPTSETLPAASQLIVVPTFPVGSKETAAEVTLTDSSQIARIEQVIDALPKAPTTSAHCPLDNGAGMALDFEDAQNTTLADVVIGVLGCQRVQVSINGYNEPALADGQQAAAQIQAILGTHWDLVQTPGS